MSKPRQSSVLERLTVEQCEASKDSLAKRQNSAHKTQLDNLVRKAKPRTLNKKTLPTRATNQPTASRIVTPTKPRRRSQAVCESSDEEAANSPKHLSIPEESEFQDNMSDIDDHPMSDNEDLSVDDHSIGGTVFSEVDRQTKTGPRPTHFKPIGGDEHTTDRSFGKRALRHFLEQRPATNGCPKMQKGGGWVLKTGCDCAASLTEAIRLQHENLKAEVGDDEALRRMKREWIPVFEKFSSTLRPMWQDPTSSEGLFSLLSHCIPFNKNFKQNSAPEYLVCVNEKCIHLCFGAFVEVTGAEYHYKAMQEFQSRFLSGSNGKWKRTDSTHFYLHGFAQRNAMRLLTWRALVDMFLEDLLDGNGAHYIPMDDINARSVLQRLDSLNVRFSQDSVEQNFQVFRTQYYPPVARTVKALAENGNDLLVIAHPKMSRFATVLPTGAAGEAGKVTHTLIGVPSFGPLIHQANAGTIAVDVGNDLFKAMAAQIDLMAGHNGIRTYPVREAGAPRFLGPVHLCEHLVYKSTGPVLGDSIPTLMSDMMFSADAIADMANLSGEFMDRCYQVCKSLLPPERRKQEYHFATISGVMKTTIHNNDLTVGQIKIQASHTDFSIAQNQQFQSDGIHAFTANLPLTEEGVFLRINEKVDYTEPQTLPGKLFFVPQGAMFIHPGTMVHAGAFRSGPRGNLRMHFVFFLIPKSQDPESNPLDGLPTEFISEYLDTVDHGRHDVLVYDHRIVTGDTTIQEVRQSRPNSPLYDLNWMEDFAKFFSV